MNIIDFLHGLMIYYKYKMMILLYKIQELMYEKYKKE